jgi:ferredoxin
VTRARARGAVDVLEWPLVGPFLKWRHSRTAVQVFLLLLAALVVLHGLLGPDLSSTNLSTVLIWVHYRGLLVVALLVAANFFCAGCPFVLVRDWGRRLHVPTHRWPRWLRGKWLAVGLFAAVLFTYEWLDLWSLPRSTAYLVLAYFAAALAIDLVFTGASFCKHVCPVGQFNFVASTVSPLELQVRHEPVCRSCKTSDCIAGNRTISQRGCELGLFLPRKVGNLDCTFCLDCVHACPHDNIGLVSRVPALELADGARRSGIGRLTARPDLAALVVVFVFGALVNAVAMTSSGRHIDLWLASATAIGSDGVRLAIVVGVGLFLLPAALLASSSALSRLLSSGADSLGRIANSYVFGLVPVGLGIWVAHYGFHLLTGGLVVVPVTQNAVLQVLGWPAFGEPLWRLTGLRAGVVFPIQIGVILLGAMGAGGLMYLIAERESPHAAPRAALPFVILVLTLAVAALWVVAQPMDMRGVGFGGWG